MKQTAWIFPGQGSQSQGMLSELAQAFPIVKETFAQASEVIKKDLWQISQEDTDSLLNQTAWTQPIMLSAGIACLRVYRQHFDGKDALFLCGHSLGEYTALVAGNSLSFENAIHLVHKRGQYMQDAVREGEGAMAAILGLADEDIIEICQKSGEVSAANFNAPGQVVIAGRKENVALAAEHCRKAGAKRALILPVSVPSHCQLMHPAAERLRPIIDETAFNLPHIPIVQNKDACVHHSREDILQALIAQLYSPVLWTASMQFLINHGIDCVLEMGSGKVLTNLMKRIDRNVKAYSLNTPSAFEEIIQEMEKNT